MNDQGGGSRMFRYILAGIGSLIFLTVIFGSWYTIDQRERGVITTFGKVTSVEQPGLGFKTPWVTSLHTFDIGTRNSSWDGESSLAVYSKDQQPAFVTASVTWRIDAGRVEEIYTRFGDADNLAHRVLFPRTAAVFKNVFGGFTAVSAVQDRPTLNRLFNEAVIAAVAGEPIVIESAQITNIDFSDAYEASIEQRMQAEVEVQKLHQNAAREKVQAEIVVTQATAQANAVRQTAQAEADAIKLRGEATATAIRARGAALADNPSLVALTQAERWNGVLPTTMVPGGSVPMLSVGR